MKLSDAQRRAMHRLAEPGAESRVEAGSNTHPSYCALKRKGLVRWRLDPARIWGGHWRLTAEGRTYCGVIVKRAHAEMIDQDAPAASPVSTAALAYGGDISQDEHDRQAEWINQRPTVEALREVAGEPVSSLGAVGGRHRDFDPTDNDARRFLRRLMPYALGPEAPTIGGRTIEQFLLEYDAWKEGRR
jgi:hypothetical protein